ncbi:MAG TPA: hypothetical protein P5050_02810 [Bacteroidia bacterium]|nr:hypothetical protein [Bacteroidia bacterium]HRS58132.1 hypothetical protein [Bacteroidia bacterium]HRU68757.1 hypothetical protein [Bacteroidia bacterium]
MTENRKFEPESEILSEINDNHEEVLDEETSNGKGLYILLAIFIILFFTTASFFVYFQFYQGNGQWRFSLQKHSVDLKLTDSLRTENQQLKKVIDSLSVLAYNKQLEDTQTAGPIFTSGISGEKYEVQIGYFKNFSFSRYAPSLINMNIDTVNQSIRLMIGRFDKLEDACRFKKDIVEMGIKNAFIVKKVDGKRVEANIPCP